MNSDTARYRGYRFPCEIISHGIWFYHRFCLSFRDVEDLLSQRGITVSYEAIRLWCIKFGPEYARRVKRRQGRLGDTWHIDEVFVTIQGRRQYLWRALIKMVMCLISWFSRVATRVRRSAFSASC